MVMRAEKLRAKMLARCKGCGKRLPPGRRLWCSKRCCDKAQWQETALDADKLLKERARVRRLKQSQALQRR